MKNINKKQYIEYVVFVDGMDGDIYYGLDEMNHAVSKAFTNHAREVIIKFYSPKLETPSSVRKKLLPKVNCVKTKIIIDKQVEGWIKVIRILKK
jgi:hypothetical protein